ncbi:MAG: GIY-YIG nuclease family protein [Chloroflexales bacterium]|jgi:Uri superfamily endonuclease
MAKGSYVLVLHLDHAITDLQVGRLGSFNFPAGYYLYVGSAFGAGGLAARLRHHERGDASRPHWHIDYLRAHARLCEIWTVSGPLRMECRWCAALTAEPGVSLPAVGFGSRDTGCRSHLFYLSRPPHSRMLSRILLSDLTSTDSPLEILVEVHSFDI